MPQITVPGSLVLTNIPDNQCFSEGSDFTDLLKALTQYLGVSIPTSITNVVVSVSEPTDSQTSSLWIRINNAGKVLGFYGFSDGRWVPFSEQIGPDMRGAVALVGGSATVNTPMIGTNDSVLLTVQTPGGTQGFLSVPSGSIVNGTSFVINSTSGTDTSAVYWEIRKPIP